VPNHISINKINERVKEEKGFLRREVKQVTLSGYCSGSLVAKRCLCSCSDSVGILSMPTDNGATLEMKTHTLIIFNSQVHITLLLDQNNCDLAIFDNVFNQEKE